MNFYCWRKMNNLYCLVRSYELTRHEAPLSHFRVFTAFFFFVWADVLESFTASDIWTCVQKPRCQALTHCKQAVGPVSEMILGTSCYNVVCSLLFCTTLASCWVSQAPSVHSWAEAADASSKAVQPDPSESGKSHSRWRLTDIGDEIMKPGSITFPLSIPSAIKG